MTAPPLSPVARWCLAHLVPAGWQDSIEGDLVEECERRTRAERPAGVIWQCGAILAIGVRLRLEHVPSYVTERARPRRRHLAEALWMDTRYALRGLVADRAYAVTAILTLALGIGANAAVFNVANWLVYRPLPGVGRPSELVGIKLGNEATSVEPLSLAEIEKLAAMTPALSGIAVNDSLSTANISIAHRLAERASVELVTSNYFDVLQAPLEAGRTFTGAEATTPTMPAVVIISDRLRRAGFAPNEDPIGADPHDERPADDDCRHRAAEFCRDQIRRHHRRVVAGGQGISCGHCGHGAVQRTTFSRSRRFFTLVGRIRPGVSKGVVSQQLAHAEAELSAASASGDTRWTRHHFMLSTGLDYRIKERDELTDAFAMLLAFSGILLILACANVSNAVLARSTSRAYEVATRLAIGATRIDIARMFLVEGALIAALAGLVAAALSWATARVLQGVVILPTLAAMDIARPDWRVLAWGVGLATVAALGTSLSPIIAVRRADVVLALKSTGMDRTHRSGVRRALTTVQVALSVILLVGAALLARSMRARLSVDPGFDATRVLTFSLAPNVAPGQTPFPLHRAIEDRMARVPGIRSATVAFLPPFYNGNEMRLVFHTDARPATVTLALNPVGLRFFETIGVPFVAGRDFTDEELRSADPISQGPVVLTEAVARRVFGSADAAVGQTVITNTKHGGRSSA